MDRRRLSGGIDRDNLRAIGRTRPLIRIARVNTEQIDARQSWKEGSLSSNFIGNSLALRREIDI